MNPFLAEGNNTLIDRLKRETRTCPQCLLEVRHPFIERCPRCFSMLPKILVECAGCIHELICPVAKSSFSLSTHPTHTPPME
jgi:predicted amidophosphoribosyltransferase